MTEAEVREEGRRIVADMRKKIDEEDRAIVAAVVRRRAMVKEAHAVKWSRGLPVDDPGREAEIVSGYARAGAEAGAPPDALAALAVEVLRACRR